MVLLSPIIHEGSTANKKRPVHFRAGRTTEASTGIFRRVPLTWGAPCFCHIAFAIFKNWPSLRGQISPRCFKLIRLISFMQPGLQGDICKIFLEKNPDVDFFSWAAYWPPEVVWIFDERSRPWLRTVGSWVFLCCFFCVFLAGLRGGKNERLKYIWLVNPFCFSHCWIWDNLDDVFFCVFCT